MNWLDRARRELAETSRRRTAVTAERPPTAVLAVGTADISDSTAAEALRGEWEERAAIMEFDGGLAREEAERLASLSIYGSTRLH